MSLKRGSIYIMIASVSISALIGIGVLLFGNFGKLEVRILATTLTVTVASILGLACGAYFETGRAKVLPVAGVALAVVAALMTFLIIWDVEDESDVFMKATGTVSMLALSCSHLSLLSLARLNSRFAWSRILAFACVWTLTAILIYLMWFVPDGSSDIVARIIGILSILIAAVTIVTPIFHKLSGDVTSESIDSEIAVLRRKIEDVEARKAAIGETP